MPNTQVSQEEKEYHEMCDTEHQFSKPEIEMQIDNLTKMVVQSDYFDLMEQGERIDAIYFIQFCKQAMYRCYF
jgi:hypothetical protein